MRAQSFGAAAAAYAEHRPGYPDAAVSWVLEPVSGRRLLDLGAGTGKLTESLIGRGEVVSVDPDPAMLEQLRARFPTVDARAGSAESIPVPDASVDAVLIGQAWHWFDPERAFPEIARVLRPGGVLAAMWNHDDRRVDWVAGFQDAASENRPAPSLPPEHSPRALPAHDDFHPGDKARFPNPVRTTIDGLIATLATHSWALISEPADREAAFQRVRDYLGARPETSSGEFELPMFTDVLRALRR